MKTSTDLHEVKNNPVEFSWGEIIKFYELEEFTIASFFPNNAGKRILFHVWVDKKDIGMYFDSLEEALIGAIAFKHEGFHSEAARYFMKMIKGN